MAEFAERPTPEQLENTVFVANDRSFSITVPEADHALMHYNEMVQTALRTADPEASTNGLMGACLAHAMHWTEEAGLKAMTENLYFQHLITLMKDTYNDCKAQGLYDSPQARLS